MSSSAVLLLVAAFITLSTASFPGCNRTFSCGAVLNLSYPFTGGDRPDHCGPPEFRLTCRNDFPELTSNGSTYRVIQANQTHQTLTLARLDLWNNTCPRAFVNSTLDSTIFNYSIAAGNDDLTLVYGCNASLMFAVAPVNRFSCSVAGTDYTDAYYFVGSITNDPLLRIVRCSNAVWLPLLGTVAEQLASNQMTLAGALTGGFTAEYTDPYSAECFKCTTSGAQCGFNRNSSGPICICGDTQCFPSGKKKSMNVAVIVVPIVALILIAISACFAWRRGKKKRGAVLRTTNDDRVTQRGVVSRTTTDRVTLEDLPIYDFGKLAAATGNFYSENKLGEGGFGPVYKGTLADGQEIAVKRLSRSSGQGLEEFMNEVVVISKLQHRNLVRLLGCCIERGEKMLVYEYMPNGGLHSLLFDQVRQKFLDWEKRVNIIEGIARGLLYLHRDSRLKIIHRDLKASNILLDQNLNPKISDFGMAKIFGDDKDQEKTGRVVGTYGYMAPEYAMQGSFSEKSDVYSFGVLLLEIVSGRRNSSFYNEEHPWSLSRLAWKLWNEEKIFELIDRTICDPRNEWEILRCVHVGLLCVQEFAKDRPTVSTVLSMLTSETADLPTPKEPAFVERHTSSENQASPIVEQIFSAKASVTLLEGR